MKESTLILFQVKSIVKDITLEPLGVPDFHLGSQECPPKSESVPDGCLIYLFTFLLNRGVFYIKLYEYLKANLLVDSKSIMNTILEAKK